MRAAALALAAGFALNCGALAETFAGAGVIGNRAAIRDTATGPAASNVVSAIAARLEQQGDAARLVFELTGQVSASAFPVVDPYRIVVDLPEIAFLIDPDVGRPAPRGRRGRDAAQAPSPLVQSFRFGRFAAGRSRVVIDLARPAKIIRAASEEQQSGARLVIELEPSDASSFAAAAGEHARLTPPPPAAQLDSQAPAGNSAKPIVVIDPGHGGVDVGAAGVHGEQEKAIVFDFARTLAAKIEAGGGLRAILTRTDDVFVSLDDRVRFARQNDAALFVSIHADTLDEPSVEGATVYTASNLASDADAARIAETENFADQAAGLEHKEDASGVDGILVDLTRRETRAYSRLFAATLISQWKNAASLNKNPSRSAGFVVLKAHDVPSVLLELGYLSSEQDLARLTSPQWREQAADATAQAIEAFFAARERRAQAVASSQRAR
ncbi:MAG: N-acetylmuramoyl-L-alanine amidase [Methylocystis sp.]|nr:N-acetylmuramoyl-L-alanine amidase [Methylocystis sp.]